MSDKNEEYCLNIFLYSFTMIAIGLVMLCSYFGICAVNELIGHEPKSISYCHVEKTSDAISTEYALKAISNWRLNHKTLEVYPSAKEAFDAAKALKCEVR
jgi:hypothetical protein